MERFDNIHDSDVPEINKERTIISDLIQVLESFHKKVDISIDVPWLQPLTIQTRVLESLTCITRLELRLFPRRPPPRKDSREDDYMDIVAGVLHKNPRIRTLHLELNLKRALGRLRDHKYHNVPLFGSYVLGKLKDIHLEGDLSFMIEDWVRWDAHVTWTNLTTLQLINLPLVLQVLFHCAHKLPNLHTLHVRAHRKDAGQEEITPLLDIPSSTIIKDFLSSTNLTELDLSDLTRDLPLRDILGGSGARLHRLRLHVNVQKRLGENVPVSGLYWGETAFLSSGQLDYLNGTCPHLKQLGLDAEESDVTFPVKYKPKHPLSQFDFFYSPSHCSSLYLRFVVFAVSRSFIIENPDILSSRERLLLRCSKIYAAPNGASHWNV